MIPIVYALFNLSRPKLSVITAPLDPAVELNTRHLEKQWAHTAAFDHFRKKKDEAITELRINPRREAWKFVVRDMRIKRFQRRGAESRRFGSRGIRKKSPRTVRAMMKLNRNLVISLSFWLVFIAAVLLNEKYRTVNSIWVVVGFAVVVWRSIYVFVDLFRDKKNPGEKRILIGLPNWYSRFLLDSDYDKKQIAKDSTDRSAMK